MNAERAGSVRSQLAATVLVSALLACGYPAILCGATAGVSAGSVTVRAVVPPVSVRHDGNPTPVAVTAKMILADGDELKGETRAASLQLECPNGATQTLSNQLHAVVNARSANSRCAVDLKSGTAVATVLATLSGRNTGNDASISGGPYAMTSHHTQFGLTVAPGARADAEAFVVEGEAVVRTSAERAPLALREGEAFSSVAGKVARISEQTFQRVATAYAQLDLAQLGRVATPQIAATLQSQWLAALKQPSDAAARKALAETHRRFEIDSLVSRYQLARTNTFQNPMQGGYRLEYCLPDNRCGEPTAHAWCRARGFAKAASWTPDFDIGASTPTQRMGGTEICNRGPCDGFAAIVCQ